MPGDGIFVPPLGIFCRGKNDRGGIINDRGGIFMAGVAFLWQGVAFLVAF